MQYALHAGLMKATGWQRHSVRCFFAKSGQTKTDWHIDSTASSALQHPILSRDSRS